MIQYYNSDFLLKGIDMWQSILVALKKEKVRLCREWKNKRRLDTILIVCISLLLLSSSNALAQCGPAISVDKYLKEQLGEYQKWSGFPDKTSDQDRIMLLYENPSTKTWTLLIYKLIDDTYCFYAGGQNSTDMISKLKGSV
tara:strand:- start:3936 stop:4358 length:423 start_codon:yes stop_codon:yes gene_type:complete